MKLSLNFLNMPKIKALIIDDESLARELILNYLKDRNDIEVVGECENGFEALKAIHESKPDLLFLDIQMPKIDGFELLEVLDGKASVIFTTAYDQYAQKAFEKNAIDYLLKPFSKVRLWQAIDKAISMLPSGENKKVIEKVRSFVEEADYILNRIVVKKGLKIIVIPIDSIHYIEAQDDYVMIYTESGKYLKDKSMKFYEAHLPADFIRIHRTYIVALSQIDTIEQYGKESHLVALKCGARLRASISGYKRLKEVL